MDRRQGEFSYFLVGQSAGYGGIADDRVPPAHSDEDGCVFQCLSTSRELRSDEMFYASSRARFNFSRLSTVSIPPLLVFAWGNSNDNLVSGNATRRPFAFPDAIAREGEGVGGVKEYVAVLGCGGAS